MFSFGLWNSYTMLLMALFFNGLFQGPVWPALCKSVCAWYPDLRLNSVIGFLSTSGFIGGFTGTAVAVKLQTCKSPSKNQYHNQHYSVCECLFVCEDFESFFENKKNLHVAAEGWKA